MGVAGALYGVDGLVEAVELSITRPKKIGQGVGVLEIIA